MLALTLHRRGRRLVAMVAISFVVGGAAWRWVSPQPDDSFTVSVEIDGAPRDVQIEHFAPRGTGRHAAIVLLHGVEGPYRYRWQRQRVAADLRRRGYHVFIVHYFDAVSYEDLWLLDEEGELAVKEIDAHCLADAPRWTSAVVGAVDALSRREDVDPARIALFGYSLGGFISLAAAEDCQCGPAADVRCVVVNWGSHFQSTQFSDRSPDTFFVHGEEDQTVPLAWARETLRQMTAAGAQAKLCVIPGAKHPAFSWEARRQTHEFLAERLAEEQ